MSRPDGLACLYVLSFADRKVKVGWSGSPATRIDAHRREAVRHQNHVVRQWVSEPHRGAQVTERALLRWCRKQPDAVAIDGGREWFIGLDMLATAVQAGRIVAERLRTHPPVPAAEVDDFREPQPPILGLGQAMTVGVEAAHAVLRDILEARGLLTPELASAVDLARRGADEVVAEAHDDWTMWDPGPRLNLPEAVRIGRWVADRPE